MSYDIPMPCHKKWEGMTPTERGRFCGSCQKEVVDLTGSDPSAIKKVLHQPGGPPCVKISNSQLHRLNQNQWDPKKWVRAACLALFTGFITIPSPKAVAQTVQRTPLTEKTTLVKLEATPSENITIRGTVVDKETKEPFFAAAVYFKNTEPAEGAMVGFDGHFELKTNRDFLLENPILTVSFIGYKTLEVDLSQKLSEANLEMLHLDLKLEMDVAVIGLVGIIVMSEPDPVDEWGNWTIRFDNFGNPAW